MVLPYTLAVLLLFCCHSLQSPSLPHGYDPLQHPLVDTTGRDVDVRCLEPQPTQHWTFKGKKFMRQGAITYQLLSHPNFPDYKIRVTSPVMCNHEVIQYSGYIDNSVGKHTFFWFFESRAEPENAPLIIRTNGQPGCSSLASLLFEIGPCSINSANSTKGGTSLNPYSWNSNANLLFIDEVNTGYSYSCGHQPASNSTAIARDTFAFLQLFLSQYPRYVNLPVHLTSDGFGSSLAIAIAAYIQRQNRDMQLQAPIPTPGLIQIKLASLVLGSPMVDPLLQVASIVRYACCGDSSKLPVFGEDWKTCTDLETKLPGCEKLIGQCYKEGSGPTCASAHATCKRGLLDEPLHHGLNPYDIRRKCDQKTNGPYCYRELNDIEKWLGIPAVKEDLGVVPDVTFQLCNRKVAKQYRDGGSLFHNSSAIVNSLVNEGVRLLVFAGDSDLPFNHIGNYAWMRGLGTKFHPEFASANRSVWRTLNQVEAGYFRTAGSTSGTRATAGNFTFVRVFDAGHMAAHDQPMPLLDLITRWTTDVSLLTP